MLSASTRRIAASSCAVVCLMGDDAVVRVRRLRPEAMAETRRPRHPRASKPPVCFCWFLGEICGWLPWATVDCTSNRTPLEPFRSTVHAVHAIESRDRRPNPRPNQVCVLSSFLIEMWVPESAITRARKISLRRSQEPQGYLERIAKGEKECPRPRKLLPAFQKEPTGGARL